MIVYPAGCEVEDRRVFLYSGKVASGIDAGYAGGTRTHCEVEDIGTFVGICSDEIFEQRDRLLCREYVIPNPIVIEYGDRHLIVPEVVVQYGVFPGVDLALLDPAECFADGMVLLAFPMLRIVKRLLAVKYRDKFVAFAWLAAGVEKIGMGIFDPNPIIAKYREIA